MITFQSYSYISFSLNIFKTLPILNRHQQITFSSCQEYIWLFTAEIGDNDLATQFWSEKTAKFFRLITFG